MAKVKAASICSPPVPRGEPPSKSRGVKFASKPPKLGELNPVSLVIKVWTKYLVTLTFGSKLPLNET